MTNFLDLPLEIRNQIYQYSIVDPENQENSAQLCNRSEITRYSFPHIGYIDSRNGVIDDDRMPGREFILVSKRVHEECKVALFQELTFYWDNPMRFLHDCNSWGDILRDEVRMVEFAVTPLITETGSAEHAHRLCREGIHEEATCKSGSWETGLWEQAFGILDSFQSIRHFDLILWKKSWSVVGGLNMARALTCLNNVAVTEDGVQWQKDYKDIVREAKQDGPVPSPGDPVYWECLDDVNYLNHLRFKKFLDMLRRVRVKGFLKREDRQILKTANVRVNWLSNSFGKNKFYLMTWKGTNMVIDKIARAFGGIMCENVIFGGSLTDRTTLRPKLANSDMNLACVRSEINLDSYPDMFLEMWNDKRFQRHGIYSANLSIPGVGSSVPTSERYYKPTRLIDRNAANSYQKLRQYNRRAIRSWRLQRSRQLASGQGDEPVGIQQPGAPVRRRRLHRGIRPRTEEEAAPIGERIVHGPSQKLRRGYKRAMRSWRLRQPNQSGLDQQDESGSSHEPEAPIRRRRLCRGIKPQI
ncbi:hypothetical protein OCU04_012147 [Sclerotinia nivalis]|uniref:F-box domain-containing protein n=1 Tax=Sclerotinia nivalis TaxID=352851 RepID=A0A9X0AE43_9HELO|nr:hypothetical protein OCU04_012147 [Sclerotinia nivalis]